MNACEVIVDKNAKAYQEFNSHEEELNFVGSQGLYQNPGYNNFNNNSRKFYDLSYRNSMCWFPKICSILKRTSHSRISIKMPALVVVVISAPSSFHQSPGATNLHQTLKFSFSIFFSNIFCTLTLSFEIFSSSLDLPIVVFSSTICSSILILPLVVSSLGFSNIILVLVHYSFL